MFLKKVDGPRAVTLPDGTTMTRGDLPSPKTKRWVASRKAALVKAVVHGLISQNEALEIYDISEEEFLHWVSAVSRHGEGALKTTKAMRYRQPRVE